MAYDEFLAARGGAFGGSDPASAYRRYVSAGIEDSPGSPWRDAHHGWLLGSEAFVARVARMVREQPHQEAQCESRRLQALGLSHVCQAVCAYYRIAATDLRDRGSRHPARPALAYLARQHTEATNAELVPVLGLSRPESVPSVTSRFRASLRTDASQRKALRRLEEALGVRE